LAEDTFGSISGGPKPRAEPPGFTDIKDVHFPNNWEFKSQVIQSIQALLKLVNETPAELLAHAFLRHNVCRVSDQISTIKAGSELREFRLMLILQMCALSSVGLCPDPKLLNLLHPIPDKGSFNHLLDVDVKEKDHDDAMRRASHRFGLEEFGDNGGESILCETFPGRKVIDAFFPFQSLFLLNAKGKSMQKKHGTTKWITVGGEREHHADDDSNSDTDV
jgi:hypothetical protein